jgi:hypothetical protein
MLDPTWRDVAAIWGAALSTLIVLVRLLPSRPMFFLEPGDRPSSDLTVHVINPAKSMRLVRERWRWKLTGSGSVIGVYTRQSRVDDAGVSGTLILAIKGESETVVMINCLNEHDQNGVGRWLLCFTWRGSWLVPIGFPAFVYVSTKRAAQLNSAIRSDTKQ